MTAPENTSTVYVQSEPLADGTYVTAVHYGADRSRILDRQTAMAYVADIFTAAVRAEHDAAVIRQLLGLGLDLETAAQAIADLRADRPALDDTVTVPFRLVLGVSAKTGNGFLHVHLNGVKIGQWDPRDARDHAVNVLTVLAAVDLDAAYRRYLIGTVGIDAARAGNVIADLATHLTAAVREGNAAPQATSMIPVCVPADLAVHVVRDDARLSEDSPLYCLPCPVCGHPMGAPPDPDPIALVAVGIPPDSRKPAGWTTGGAVAVHASCAGPKGWRPAPRG